MASFGKQKAIGVLSKTLFSLSKESSEVTEVRRVLGELCTLFETRQLKTSFLAQLGRTDLEAAFKAVLSALGLSEKAKVQPLLLKFLSLLTQKGMLDALSLRLIFGHYTELLELDSSAVYLRVLSAGPLDKSLLDQLEKRCAAKFNGSKVIFDSVSEDLTLIGGVEIYHDRSGWNLRASLRSRLLEFANS